MVFTDTKIRGLPSKSDRHYYVKDDACKGLTLRVLSSGIKTFYMNYAHPDTRKNVRMKLGKYPALKLKAAREKVGNARELLVENQDPKTAWGNVREKAAQNKYRQGTFGEVFEIAYFGWLSGEWGDGEPAKSLDAIKAIVERDVLDRDKVTKHKDDVVEREYIANQPATSITTDDINHILFAITERGAVVHARRFRAYLHAAFETAMAFDDEPSAQKYKIKFNIDKNPLPKQRKRKRGRNIQNSEKRALSWDEIKEVVDTDLIPYRYILQIKLILVLGGHRPNEVLGIAMSEIDFDKKIWLIPGARTKNGSDHELPLTDLAISLLKESYELCGSEGSFLFPKRGVSTATKPCSNSKLAEYIRDFCTSTGMSKFTAQQLRHTTKTRFGDLGILPHIKNHIQNHALYLGVDTQVYDAHDYMDEKREALEKWEERLKTVF